MRLAMVCCGGHCLEVLGIAIFCRVSCEMALLEAPVSTNALRVTSPTLSWRCPSLELCVDAST